MKICFFDIDGTLVDTCGAGSHSMFEAAWEEFGFEPREASIDTAGRSDRGIGRELFELYSVEETDANWDQFVGGYVQRLHEYLPAREGSVLPGVVELLEQLHARDDLALGLLTGNVREAARVKLEFFGVHHYFKFGGFGDTQPERDDIAREAVESSLKHLNGSATQYDLCVIGDTPNDVKCARAIGAKAVAVATGRFTEQDLEPTAPDLLMSDLSDPSELLDLID